MKEYTPDDIRTLKLNEVFVFGSNLAGRHGAGAAKLAMQKFGARYGVGRGLQGQSYALPTKDLEVNTMSLHDIGFEVEQFLRFADKNRHLKFYVTTIGCGLAGYTPSQIAPLFAKWCIPDNVVLPKEFWDIMGSIITPTNCSFL
jgi:hypothetical protein